MFNIKKPPEEEYTSLIHMLTRKAAEIRWTCFCFVGLMVNSSCMLTTGLGGERLGWVGAGGRWWCGEGGGEVSAFLWKGWQGLLTLWERTSYKTEEAHFHFKGSSETWHQQASLLSSPTLARCTLAHMRVHINVCACTYIHTHHLIVSHSQIHLMSPHRLLIHSLMFIRTWGKCADTVFLQD